MNYTELKTGFVEYLKSKYKTSRLNPDKFDNLDADKSIFLYANDFKQYIQKINSEQNLNLSLDGNINTGDDSQILNALNDAQSGELNSGDDLMNQLMNSFLNDENVKSMADKDGDGTVSEDEANQFFEANGNGDENLTFDELTNMFSSIQNENNVNPLMNMNSALGDLAQGDDSASVSSSSGGGSTGGGSYDSGSTDNYIADNSGVDNGSNDNGDSNPQALKSYENMSKSELEAEKQTAKSDLDSKNSKLQAYIGGSEPDPSEMNNAYEAYKSAMGEDKAQELDAIQTEITQKETGISDVLTQITAQEQAKSTAEQKFNAASNKVNALNDKKSQLEAQLNSAKPEEKESISGNIEKIKADIEKAEKEKTDAEKEKTDAEKQIDTLNSQKTTLEEELQAKKEELQAKEDEITAQNENLKELQEAYDKAKNEYDTNKQTGLKEAQEGVKTAQENINKIDTQLQKVQDEADIETKYPTPETSVKDIPSDVVNALDNKLGKGFCSKVAEVAKEIGCSPEDLLAVMSFESGISPSIVNKSSGATGLIQFMPDVAKGLGTTTSALKQMSGVEQMEYVKKYMVSRKQANIPDKEKLDAGDVYSLVFLPGYAKKDVLCERGGRYYKGNAGLDRDKDGKITKKDLYNAAWSAYKNVMKKMDVDVKTV